MNSPALFRTLADVILLIHLLFVSFVVLGFAAILVGIRTNWAWTRNRVFRTIHLVAIVLVILQAWLGRFCFLTIWENQLRELAGESSYSQTFISYWLQKILFYDVAPWVFTTIYTVFGMLVFIFWLANRRNRGKK